MVRKWYFSYKEILVAFVLGFFFEGSFVLSLEGKTLLFLMYLVIYLAV